MKGKSLIISILLSVIIFVFWLVDYMYKENYDEANTAYAVYLNGENLGLISDADRLYAIINREQESLKEKYQVESVYPPNGFNLVAVNTYDDNYVDEETIYNKIASADNFTIKGYIATIKFIPSDENEDGIEEQKEDLIINVLDKNVFEEAVKKFVLAFISDEELNEYLNGEKEELTDIGKMIETMYFNETITIKEGYINSSSKIYTDVDELSQYLLFGPDAEMTSYTVKLGDDIETISEANKLNPEEFIIANPKYRDENAILTVGSTVNVTLLDPVLTYVYEVKQIVDTTIPYEEETKTDKTKDYGYSEITQAGVTGIRRDFESYQVTNGEQGSEMKFYQKSITLREPVTKVTIVGPKRPSGNGGGGVITGVQILGDGEWTWPTNQPAIITSHYGRRWGKIHEGTDISGTGGGSPIYAAAAGTVVIARYDCKTCAQWGNGTYVVIDHGNGIHTAYLHMSGLTVSEGQVVSKGQQIGKMGMTGMANGVHLHFALFQGRPYSGQSATSLDPEKYLPIFKK